jgi:hypothetical protein
MKVSMGTAALLAAVSHIQGVLAKEHPVLASTADFRETWIEKPLHKDMISQHKENRYFKETDNSVRPVIGVLTEPLRGEMYKGHDQVGGGVDSIAGYVPRAHVQFLEQAGMRVVPVDYRLSRDELFTLFD